MQVSSKNRPSDTALRKASAAANGVRPAAAGRMAEPPKGYGTWLALCARFTGAVSLLAVGAVHLQQYEFLYSAIPTIGTLFLLNFAGATLIGLGLLAPIERVLGRFGGMAVMMLALGGALQAATAFTFLLISERTPLFGFMEPGYDPPALTASRVAELVTVGLLGSFLVARFARRSSAGRW